MKTKEQKQAWREILIMISDRDWDNNPVNVQRHRELMEVLEMPLEAKKKLPISLDVQKYLDSRPGIEADILIMILQKMTVKEMQKIYPINKCAFTFIRKKYGVPRKRCLAPSKEGLEKVYLEKGIEGAAKQWGVSEKTVYGWLDSRGIERLRQNRGSKKNRRKR